MLRLSKHSEIFYQHAESCPWQSARITSSKSNSVCELLQPVGDDFDDLWFMVGVEMICSGDDFIARAGAAGFR